MNDRTLLELAAKAYADANVNFDGLSFVRFIGRNEDLGCNVMVTWNPLLDDGDALRLAVKLKISLQTGSNVAWASLVTPDKVGNEWIAENFNGDANAATRRAIVRAAAEIGKLL